MYFLITIFNNLHWESLEVFNSMDTNKRYKVSGYGIRVPVLGMFPIIVKAKKV